MRLHFVALFLALIPSDAGFAQASAPARNDPAWPAWTDLFDGASLTGWVRTDFGGGGAVEIVDGGIQLDFGQPLTGITYSGEVPRTGYELEVEAARLQGNDFFCGLTVPVGAQQATLILGGWGGALVGLSCIDGQDASENESTQYRKFEQGQAVRIRIRVTDQVISAWMDDDVVLDLKRAGRTFSLRPEVRASAPLGLASFMTRALISRVRLRRLEEAPPLPEPLRGLGLEPGSSPGRNQAGWTRPTRVVVIDPGDGWRERFTRAAEGVEVVFVKAGSEAAREAKDADGVVGICTAEIVSSGPRLRWIQVGSAGVERYLAIPELVEREIVLTNGQRLAGVPIAEHALALVLALSRGLPAAVGLKAAGAWDRSALIDNGGLLELDGKTLLVLGLGGIGTEVARRAKAFGMRVLATRRTSREGPEFVDRVGLAEETLSLVREADVVVNCLPHTPETERLVDAEFLEAMKPSALFVNVGRGKTVDTDALVRALSSGAIRAAGLDVTDPEPLPAEHPLWRLENVLITPHVAARSLEQTERRLWLYVENLRRFVEGEPLLNEVDQRAGY